MRHSVRASKSPRARGHVLADHHLAVDPWRVIQYLEHRLSEKRKRAPTPVGDLDPTLVDLFSSLKRRIRQAN